MPQLLKKPIHLLHLASLMKNPRNHKLRIQQVFSKRTTQTFRSTEQIFTLQHGRKKESLTSFKIINSCQIWICFKALDQTRKNCSLKIIFITFSHKLNICTHPWVGQRPSTIFETWFLDKFSMTKNQKHPSQKPYHTTHVEQNGFMGVTPCVGVQERSIC